MQACRLHEHSGNCSLNCFIEVIWTFSVLCNKADAIIFWNVKVVLDPFFFSSQTLKTLQPNTADCHNLWCKNTFKITWSRVSFFYRSENNFENLIGFYIKSFVFEFGEEKCKVQSEELIKMISFRKSIEIYYTHFPLDYSKSILFLTSNSFIFLTPRIS